jgi:hypothetical protein
MIFFTTRTQSATAITMLGATSSPHVASLISVASSSLQRGYSCSCAFSLILSLSRDPTKINVPLSAGYPIYSHFTRKAQSRQGAFNIGGINASGQVPALPHNIALIDADTPQSAYTKASFNDPTQKWDLVFSDEFNLDGRSFNPGDDPYWEAVDLNYWQTVSALVYAPHPADAPARVTWNGTTRSRPTQRTGPFGSRSTMPIRSTTTTCPTYQAWYAPVTSLSDHC